MRVASAGSNPAASNNINHEDEMAKIISVGKTKTQVRIEHMKRDLLYFIQEVFPGYKIQPYQKRFFDHLAEKEKEWLINHEHGKE